jgi:hypothetical protein
MLKSKVRCRALVLLVFCLILSLFSGYTSAAETLVASPSKTTFVMNGAPIAISQAYSINDNNYLQLRAIAVLLNGTDAQFNVSWDGTYAVIETGKPYTEDANPALLEITSNVKPSSTSFKINGNVVTFNNAYLIDGNTNYLQLREVAEKLSGTKSQFNVYWDSNLAQAIIEIGVAYTGTTSSFPEATSILTIDEWDYSIEVKGNWTLGADSNVGEAVNFSSDANGLLTVACLNDMGVISNTVDVVDSFLSGMDSSGTMTRIKQLQNRVVSDCEVYQYLYEYRYDESIFDALVSIIFADDAVIILTEVYSMAERWDTDEKINYVANSIVAISKKQETTPVPTSAPMPTPMPAPTPTPTPQVHYTVSYGPRGGAICWCGRYMSQH